MSRKDDRRVLVVALTAAQMRTVRGRAGRGSLGDAVRRIVEAALATDTSLAPPPGKPDPACAARRLRVQLPTRVRRRLAALGGDPADRVAACIPETRHTDGVS